MYPFQSTNGTFHRTRENNSKVCKESQSPQIAKTILIKNKGGGIMLFNIKLFILHSMIIKTLWYCHQKWTHRSIEQNRKSRNKPMHTHLTC